jgi:F420-dependent oxidoreductase-like protein
VTSPVIVGLISPDPIGLPSGLRRTVTEVALAETEGVPSFWASQELGTDALTVLSVAAGCTSSIKLGTAITPMWTRHPFVVAQEALTLQAASGGRFTLGLGLSHAQFMEPLGFAYRDLLAFAEEYLEVVVALLRDREIDHTGPRFKIRTKLVIPDAGPVSVLLAALGPRMLEVAGRIADGAITFLASPRYLETSVAPTLWRAAEGHHRRRPRMVVAVQVGITKKPERLRALARERMADYGSRPAYRRILDASLLAGPEDLLLAGTVDSVANQLEAYLRAGATEFIVEPFCEDPSGPGIWQEARETVLQLSRLMTT